MLLPLIARPRLLPSQRDKCLKMGRDLLARLNISHLFIRKLEAEVYKQSTWQGTKFYKSKLAQLVFNLKHNPQLVNMYDGQLDVLVGLDDAALRKGTVAEKWMLDYDAAAEREALLLSDGGDEADEDSGFVCSRCKSRAIAIEQKQTRGADEASSLFCTCKKCDHRWKM